MLVLWNHGIMSWKIAWKKVCLEKVQLMALVVTRVKKWVRHVILWVEEKAKSSCEFTESSGVEGKEDSEHTVQEVVELEDEKKSFKKYSVHFTIG